MNGAPLRNFAPPTPQQQQQQQQQQLQQQQQQHQLQLHQHQQLQQQLQAAVAAAAASTSGGGAADTPRTPTTPGINRPPTHWPNLSPDLQSLRPPFYPRLDPALANRLYFGHLQGSGGGGGGPTGGVSALQFQQPNAGAAGSAAAANAANAALLQQSAAYQHYMLAGSNAAAAAAAQHYAAASRLPPYLDPATFLANSAIPRYPYLLNAPSSPSTRHPHSPQQSTGMPPPPPPGPLPLSAAPSSLERSYSESDGVLGSGASLMGLRDAHQRKLSAQIPSVSRHGHTQIGGLQLATTSSSATTPSRPKLDPRTGPTELGATLPTQPYYPSHFMRGTVIQLASGELKRVEELNTEDFIRSASLSDDLKMDSSTVVRVEEKTKDTSVLLCFSVGEHKVQVSVEATVEHPFFVIGQGWSSCNPDRTRNLYGLPCQRLQVGDICISLTHRDVHTRLPPTVAGVTEPRLARQSATIAAASSSSSATTGSTLSLPTMAAAAVASISASSAAEPASSSGRRSAPASCAFPPIGSKRRWSVSS